MRNSSLASAFDLKKAGCAVMVPPLQPPPEYFAALAVELKLGLSEDLELLQLELGVDVLSMCLKRCVRDWRGTPMGNTWAPVGLPGTDT